MTALSPFALGTAAALLLAGCTAVPMPGSLDRALLARRPSSLAGWQDETTPRGLTLKSTERRTALLLIGWKSPTVTTFTDAAGTQHTFVLGPSQGASVGSAVPITRDGYFLTAAHCVADARQLKVFALTRDLRLTKAEARVVWTSGLKLGGADLALIHAPLDLAKPFPLADPTSLAPGDPVALTGWSKLGFHDSTGKSAGRLVSVSPPEHGAAGFSWRVVEHNAPFNSGDSGGPLITPGGRLVAINAQAVPSMLAFLRVMTGSTGPSDRPIAGYTSRAFAPDLDWLWQTIVADRAVHGLSPSRKN